MKLFVANTTKQDHFFTYRLVEKQNHAARKIQAGRQVLLSGDFGQTEIDTIIAQNSIYGLRSAKEVSRFKNFVGYIYSIDSPVKMDGMLEVYEKNDEVKDADAQKRREVTAAAISTQIGDELSRRSGENSPPMRLEVEVSTEGDTDKGVASGVEVVGNLSKIKSRRSTGG
jgi:hypothetical protein